MSNYDQRFTCIECSHSYDDSDGDSDERMCNECLDGDEYVEPFETNLITLRIDRDDYSHADKTFSELDKEIHEHPMGVGFAHKDVKSNGEIK